MLAKTRKNGWLIVNEFLNNDKFSELTQWFLIAAGRNGVGLKVMTNAELLAGMQLPERPDFVLFWDKDVRLAKYLESFGIPVFNSAESIALCDDKCMTYLKLLDTTLPMPKTIVAPFTYQNIGYNKLDFLDLVEQELSYPFVLKEAFGSFGMQVYLVHNRDELLQKVAKISPRPMLFQEFLSEYAGTDVRLQVVGDEVVASMFRYSTDGDFRANITLGGKMQNYVPTERQKEIALEAVKTLGLSFAGVDLLFGHDEEPVLCEVNSNAHFKSIFECTGVNVADLMISHVLMKSAK